MLALPGIVTGMVLAFARSLGEFGATITFVSNIPGETQTLSLALYSLSQIPGSEAAAARLAVLSVLVAVVALIASEVLARRVRRQTGQLAGGRTMIEIDVEATLGSFPLKAHVDAPPPA